MAIVTIAASKATPSEAIKYITNHQKATISTVRNLDSSYDLAAQMRTTAKLWGKAQGRDSRKYYHLKISFAPEDWARNGGTLTAEKALKIGAQVMRETFETRECVLAAHEDTGALHVHAIINSVDLFSGKMLDMRDSEYKKLKDRVQSICKENNLVDIDWRRAVADKRAQERQSEKPVDETFAETGLKERGKSSWKETLRNCIDEALQSCKTMAEFKASLAAHGIVLTRCTDQTISYKLADHKACRGDSLGGDYTAAAVRSALEHNRQQIDIGQQNHEPGTAAEKILEADAYGNRIADEDRNKFREWGRVAGFKRAEIDAMCDQKQASWAEKQRVWDEYKAAKATFWAEYNKRSQMLSTAIDEAYKRRRKVKDAEWAIDPRNRRKTFLGLIYAAIVFSRNDHISVIDREISQCRQELQELRQGVATFKRAANNAVGTLRAKGLSLETYIDSIKRMQDLADKLYQENNSRDRRKDDRRF